MTPPKKNGQPSETTEQPSNLSPKLPQNTYPFSQSNITSTKTDAYQKTAGLTSGYQPSEQTAAEQEKPADHLESNISSSGETELTPAADGAPGVSPHTDFSPGAHNTTLNDTEHPHEEPEGHTPPAVDYKESADITADSPPVSSPIPLGTDPAFTDDPVAPSASPLDGDDQQTTSEKKTIPPVQAETAYLTVDEAQAYINSQPSFTDKSDLPAQETDAQPEQKEEQENTPRHESPSVDAGQISPTSALAGAVLHKSPEAGATTQKDSTLADSDNKQSVQPGKGGGKSGKKDSSGTKKTAFRKTSDTSPKLPFFSSHPILATTPSMPAGFSTRIFNACSLVPWAILALFFIAQTIFTLDARSLWYSDEVRHAAVFTSMLESGKLFVLELNGQLYPDKPPLYFWFLRGLYEVIQEEGPRLYLGAAALCGLLYLWATMLLGRLAGRFDGRSLFAGGILLISGSYFMGVTHYARMDLLFSTLIIGSYTAFFVAFTKAKAPFLMLAAFVLAALACLTKGPLGLLFPLAALLLFAIWRGKLRRFFAFDFLLGCVAATLIIGGWLAGVYYETGSTAYILEELIGGQVIERAVDAQHHRAKWAYYIERLPILLLPWVTLIFCLPFHRIFSKSTRTAILSSRTPEREGQAFLWCIVLSAIILASVISTKIIIYLLPALPAMCLLAGRAVLHFKGKRATIFKILLAVTLLLAGVALLVGSMALFGSVSLPEYLSRHIPAWEITPSAGFIITTCILCAAALFLLLGYRSSRPEGLLLTLALMSVAIAYPLFGLAAPSLDAILSPKAQGKVFRQYIDQGYYPLSYSVYGGTYTYYAGTNIEKLGSLDELDELLETHPNIIIGLQQRALDKRPGTLPECFEPVHSQMIEQHEHVLLACPPLPQEEQPKEQPDGQADGQSSVPGDAQNGVPSSNQEQTAPPVTPADGQVPGGLPEDSNETELSDENKEIVPSGPENGKEAPVDADGTDKFPAADPPHATGQVAKDTAEPDTNLVQPHDNPVPGAATDSPATEPTNEPATSPGSFDVESSGESGTATKTEKPGQMSEEEQSADNTGPAVAPESVIPAQPAAQPQQHETQSQSTPSESSTSATKQP